MHYLRPAIVALLALAVLVAALSAPVATSTATDVSAISGSTQRNLSGQNPVMGAEARLNAFQSDLKILGQSVTAADPNGPPLIGDDGYDNDADTLTDEDGAGDCDGDTNPDDDGDTAVDEDGGDCPVIDVDKGIHNNGPDGPTPYIISKSITATDPNGVPVACTFTQLSSDPFSGSLEVNTSVNHNESWVMDCPMLGYGVDDDGDSPQQPCGAGPYIAPPCVNFVDEDPPDGADNDGDTLVDEDGHGSIEVVVVTNSILPDDPNIIDPDLSNNDDTDSSLVRERQLPFDPTFAAYQDEVDANRRTSPAPNIDCLTGQPCKVQWGYDIPGGNPLAQFAVAVPSPAYTLTRASDEAGVAKITTLVTINPLSLGSCNVLLPTIMDLMNAALPATGGDSEGALIALTGGVYAPKPMLPLQLPDNTPNHRFALETEFSWPSHLDAEVLAVNSAYPTADLIARLTGHLNIAILWPPINVLVFHDPNAFGPGVAGYLVVAVIGVPDVDGDLIVNEVDPDDDNDGLPDFIDTDDDGDTTPDTQETTNCSPLTVELVHLGESIDNFNTFAFDPDNLEDGFPVPSCVDGVDNGGDTLADSFDFDCYDFPVEGGETLIVCNEISPSFGHTLAAAFTRADSGATTTLLDKLTCSASPATPTPAPTPLSVGGVVELLSASSDAPRREASDSGLALPYVALAGVAVLTLAAGGWYARRRSR